MEDISRILGELFKLRFKTIRLPYWIMYFIGWTSQKLCLMGLGKKPLLSTTDVKSLGKNFKYSTEKAKKILGWDVKVKAQLGLSEWKSWFEEYPFVFTMETQNIKIMIATARIYIQKSPSRKTLDELCPVRLCITHNRKRRYYSIKEKIKNDDWLFVGTVDIAKIMGDSPRGKYRDIRFEYDRIVDEAKAIINRFGVFSFAKFEENYFIRISSWATIAKNSGTSTEFIKEALGHSNILVTEKYLKSFEDSTRKEHSDKIEKQIYING